MSAVGRELEVKFYLSDLEEIENRLVVQGARLVQPRTHEINLRFDRPDGELSKTHRVLRLRQDSAARLTYKGPGEIEAGVHLRQELEFTVGDFAAAQAFIEALGYQVILMYEKYRAVYALGPLMVTLDEMPYGEFAEIEGPEGESIREMAARLGLDWEARLLVSYTELFDRVRAELDLAFRDLSFANFEGLEVPAAALGARLADR